MKRKFLALTMLLSVSLILGACEKKEASESTFLSETPLVSETSASGTETKTPGDDNESAGNTDENLISGGTDTELFDAFLEGKEKAEITRSGDHAVYYSFSFAMTAGKSYTFNEMIENLSAYMKEAGWDKEPTLGAVNHELIDCGQDGKPELHIQVELPVEDIEPFVIDMIVAVQNGHLVVAYDGDSWSRSAVTVDETGFVTSGGADSAASTVFEAGFVNAAGDYIFGYKGKTTMQSIGTEYYFDTPMGLVSIDLSDVSLDGIVIEEISFEDTAIVADTYIMLYNTYVDENSADPSAFDASHPVRQAFENAGFKVITSDELTKLTNEKMAAKGYVGK